jgi:hypothetical protein
MIIAAAVLALMGAADPSPAFQSKAELQTWLTYFYREPRPELVVAALVALEDELPRHGSTLEAQAGRGGMRSFFGLVLAKSPDAVIQVEGHPFAPGTRRFVADLVKDLALRLACRDAERRRKCSIGATNPGLLVHLHERLRHQLEDRLLIVARRRERIVVRFGASMSKSASRAPSIRLSALLYGRICIARGCPC